MKYVLCVAVLLAACESHPLITDPHVAAANLFTSHYAQSSFSDWKLRATARGADCKVLLIETSVIMEDSMIETMHYGSGADDIDEGGVHRFSRNRDFRAVAYRDASDRIWTYGDITEMEAASLRPCR